MNEYDDISTTAADDDYDAISTPERRKVPREPTGALSRFATGFMDPVMGLGQIADKPIDLVRQAGWPGAPSMETALKSREAAYSPPEGFDFARVAGNLANPLNYLGGGGSTMAALLRGGAAQGAMSPTEGGLGAVDFLKEKAKQIGIGAAAAGGTGAVVKGVGRLAKPTGETATSAAQAAEDVAHGVEPTAGQVMARQGSPTGKVVDWAERQLADVPVVGTPLRKQRTAAEIKMAEFPHTYQPEVAAIQMPQTGIKYQPALRELSKDLPLTSGERDAAGQMFESIRVKHMSNLTDVQPSAIQAHAIEAEVRNAANAARGPEAKMLTRLADDYAKAWRSGLAEDQRKLVDGYTKSMKRKSEREASVAGASTLEDVVGRMVSGSFKLGRAAAAPALLGGPAHVAALAGAGLAYGTRPVQAHMTGRLSPKGQSKVLRAAKAASPGAGRTAAAAANRAAVVEEEE